MTPEEQNVFLSKWHAEAMRYMDNAQETLKRAGRDGSQYVDEKYVKTACGTAYNGVLVALDAWLKFKEVPEPNKKKQRKSIGYYTDAIANINHKMGSTLRIAYDILHLDGYYDGMLSVKAIDAGFDAAYEIIDKIKPENPVDVPETRGDRIKMALNKLMISLAVTFRF
jgi:hypothetical protein